MLKTRRELDGHSLEIFTAETSNFHLAVLNYIPVYHRD
jgi:hypothetical protein